MNQFFRKACAMVLTLSVYELTVQTNAFANVTSARQEVPTDGRNATVGEISNPVALAEFTDRCDRINKILSKGNPSDYGLESFPSCDYTFDGYDTYVTLAMETESGLVTSEPLSYSQWVSIQETPEYKTKLASVKSIAEKIERNMAGFESADEETRLRKSIETTEDAMTINQIFVPGIVGVAVTLGISFFALPAAVGIITVAAATMAAAIITNGLNDSYTDELNSKKNKLEELENERERAERAERDRLDREREEREAAERAEAERAEREAENDSNNDDVDMGWNGADNSSGGGTAGGTGGGSSGGLGGAAGGGAGGWLTGGCDGAQSNNETDGPMIPTTCRDF